MWPIVPARGGLGAAMVLPVVAMLAATPVLAQTPTAPDAGRPAAPWAPAPVDPARLAAADRLPEATGAPGRLQAERSRPDTIAEPDR